MGDAVKPADQPAIELSFFAKDLTGKSTPATISIPTSATKNVWTLFAAAAVGALAARLLDPRNQEGETNHGQQQ